MSSGAPPPASRGSSGAAAAADDADDAPQNAVCAEPKIFLGGLRYDVTQDDVKAHYASRYGPLRSVVLLSHQDTGKSKGCALVLFESWAAAEAAVLAEHGAVTPLSQPRAAVVKMADPQRNEHGALCGVTPRKLFIGQVPPDVTEDHIKGIFLPFGTIVDFNIMPPRKQGSMGCAFVTYETWAEAEAALVGVNGKVTLPGSSHAMAVKFADAKPAELAKFEARGSKRAGGGGGGAGSGSDSAATSGGGPAAGAGAAAGGGGGHGGMLAPAGPPGAGGPPGGPGAMGAAGKRGRGTMGGPVAINPVMMGHPPMMMMRPPMMGYPPMMVMGMMNPMMMGMQGMHMAPGMPPMGVPMHMPPGAGGHMLAPHAAGPPGAAAAAAGGPAGALAAAKAWKLFVGQISFDLTEQQLYPFFAQFGTILELALPRTDGRSRGYAFLTYSAQPEAVAAIEGANGAAVPGDPHARPLTVRWAENRTR